MPYTSANDLQRRRHPAPGGEDRGSGTSATQGDAGRMTRRTNSTVAGVTYLLYIAVAFPAMLLFGKATGGEGVARPLPIIAQHVGELRVTVLLGVVSSFCALVLAVTLYGITRDEDRELAMLAFACRVGEGLVGGHRRHRGEATHGRPTRQRVHR